MPKIPNAPVSGKALELRYFRDVYGREVDFVVLHNQEPIALVECKQSDADVSGSLRYLKLLPCRPSLAG